MGLNTPGSQQNNGGNNGNGTLVYKANNFNQTKTLKITLAVDSNGAITNALVFPGPNPVFMATALGVTLPNQGHYTLSSSMSKNDATGLTEFRAMLAQVGLHIKRIYITTTDPTLWNGSLWLGESSINGINSPEEITLSDKATSIGGGSYDKSLTLDRDFANTGNFFMYFSNLPASSTTTITCTVDQIADVIAVRPNS